MGFTDVTTFILSFAKKSLQLELDDHFALTNKSTETITKQAYSAARKKISPLAFVILFNAIVEKFYSMSFAKYKGYRLLAIDGSVFEIPNTAELRRTYGFAVNQTKKVARARGSILYDLKNDIIIDASITGYNVSERDLAFKHLERLQAIRTEKDLVLFDRGYPGCELIGCLVDNNIDFLMRTPVNFLKEIREVQGEDSVVEYQFKRRNYRVRVLKVLLSTGEVETLITSLFDSEFTAQDFKELYNNRWGIETKYNELKNKLQIENFTGECKIAIEQDFYASMYLANMASLAKRDAEEKRSRSERNTKYEHKINVNILIGKLKDSLVYMLLVDDEKIRGDILHQVIAEISRNVVPIRPNRSSPRKRSYSEGKYPSNKKPCL